jgi:hypothetical protein
MLPRGAIDSDSGSGNNQIVGWAKRSVPTIPHGELGEMVGTSLTLLCPPYDRIDGENHFPVFTLVHSRLMIRCVAGSRAWMTNSFFCVASSG